MDGGEGVTVRPQAQMLALFFFLGVSVCGIFELFA